MSALFSTPILFAIACSAAVLMQLLLVLFGLVGKTNGSRWSAIGLVLSVCVVATLLFLGDWKIPGCYDADGMLMSELPQCRFPF